MERTGNLYSPLLPVLIRPVMGGSVGSFQNLDKCAPQYSVDILYADGLLGTFILLLFAMDDSKE